MAKSETVPDIAIRTYTWKGEDWAAIYIDGKAVRLPLDRGKAGWLSERLGAPMICTGEARNPEYFKRYGMQTQPPPLQKPMTGVIRHPHQRDDGTWMVGPSRSEGSTWEDTVSGSSDSSSPDEP